MKDGSNQGLKETGKSFSGNPTFPGGYPKNMADTSYPGRYSYPQQSVTPEMHWKTDAQLPPSPGDYPDYGYVGFDENRKQVSINYPGQYVSGTKEQDDAQHLITDKGDHFVRDYNDPSHSLNLSEARPGRYSHTDETVDNAPYIYNQMWDEDAQSRSTTFTNEFEAERPMFTGSTTHVNPFENPTQQRIINLGLESYETERATMNSVDPRNAGTVVTKYPPISPLHPFTRINGNGTSVVRSAKQAVFKSYNRSHIPIADVEFRKAFRHVFFTRPECYVAYKESNAVGLCDQAFYDEDFSSLYSRMPHVVQLLAPSYIVGPIGDSRIDGEYILNNWNYLLSNRVLSITFGEDSLSTKDSVTKSSEGYTVTPGLHLESRVGSTISVSFRDTKDLEVYEFIKAWMLYIHKRERGIFYPPFNGYSKSNAFQPGKQVIQSNKILERMCHPYDRALEYCASLFDVVTNESDSKIIHWCKYYGIFPISVSAPLSSDNGGAITNEMKIEVTFKYHYKLPGVNKTLVEFNYNSGLCDPVGKLITPNFNNIKASQPFMVKDEKSTKSDLTNKYNVLAQHIGASGMFTGTPFILMAAMGVNPLQNPNIGSTDQVVVPVLRFADMDDSKLSALLNLGITNTIEELGRTEVLSIK